ncbi:hypothetical protein KIW84_035328 [Lathyrus oleraceus]|uniref:Pentatricopeptide repeat-containing protein n=1 Tax=Pisum sativum TaxID=3888 RepID=A0A9D4Y3D4_PEA|nr:hypothetical protein KIW84_035328 [Pisum sativum]
MKELGLSPDKITYRTLSDAYCKNGNVQEALRTKGVMERQAMLPSIETYNSLINGLLSKVVSSLYQDVRINEATVILDKMVDFDLLTVHNKCTDNLVKNNTTLVAQKIVDSLDKNAIRNSLPNNIVYNIAIDGLCKSGKIYEARSVMSVLISRGFLPDNFTYCAFIRACSASGNMDKVFKEILIEHRDFSINFIKRGWFLMLPPAILISYYCRIGDLDKAFKLKEKISQATLASKIEVQHRTSQPSFDSLKALTGSIIEHGKNLEKASREKTSCTILTTTISAARTADKTHSNTDAQPSLVPVSKATINGGGRNPVFNDNLCLNVCNVDSSLKWFVQLSIAYTGVMPDVTAISAMPGFRTQSQIRFPLSTYRQ